MVNDKRKTEEYKKFVRKYFIEQKLKEIGWAILGLALLISISYVLGDFNFLNLEPTVNCNSVWIIGFATFVIFGMMFALFFTVLWAFWIMLNDWIQSNLDKARRRADKKLNIPNTRGDYF